MTSLFVRNLQPQQYEPARTAQRIVMWYAARPRVGLWIFLMALPFVVLVTGCAALLRIWHADADLRQAARQALAASLAHLAMLLVAVAMLVSGWVLAIV